MGHLKDLTTLKSLDIFISRVIKESQKNDITRCIQNNVKIKLIKCGQLAILSDTYKAIKILVKSCARDILLILEIWPMRVTVAKYHEQKICPIAARVINSLIK